MVRIKSEHVLLSIEDLLSDYYGKIDSLVYKDARQKNGAKRSATAAIRVLTGHGKPIGKNDTGRFQISTPNIQYLPQLLIFNFHALKSAPFMGPGRAAIVQAAVKNLGYNLNDLADYTPLVLLQQNIAEKALEFSAAVERRNDARDWQGARKQEEVAYLALKKAAKEGLEKIFGLTQDAIPTAASKDNLSSEFNLSCLIEKALMQQLGEEQKPDPKTKTGKAFQYAVEHIRQSIEAQASLIKQKSLDLK